MAEDRLAKFGEIETKPLSRIRRISKSNLARNWVMIPHVTQFDEADVTGLEAFRRELDEAHAKDGIRVTLLAFVLKALVPALTKFPDSTRRSTATPWCSRNISISALLPTHLTGVIVPVIHDVDKKGRATNRERHCRARTSGAREKAQAGGYPGRMLHRLEPRRNRRHCGSRRLSTRPKWLYSDSRESRKGRRGATMPSFRG